MEKTKLITPDTRFQTSTGVARGMVGAVAIDTGGRRYGLSARHILVAEKDQRVLAADSNIVLGVVEEVTPLPSDSEGADNASFENAIATFLIDNEAISAEMATRLGPIGQTVRPTDAIGAKAIIVGADLPGQHCLVNAAGMEIFVQDPENPDNSIIYENAIELLLPRERPEGWLKDRGGALVMTETGQAVGLLIAAVDDRGYVASLDDFLRHRGLSLICNSATAKYVLHPGPGALLEVWKSDLDQAADGVKAMHQDFAADVEAEADLEVFEFEPALVEELGL